MAQALQAMVQSLNQAQAALLRDVDNMGGITGDSTQVAKSRSASHLMAARRILFIAVQAAERAQQPGANLEREGEITAHIRSIIGLLTAATQCCMYSLQVMQANLQDQQLVMQNYQALEPLEATVNEASRKIWRLAHPLEQMPRFGSLFPTPSAPIPVETILETDAYSTDPLLKAQDFLAEARSLGPVPQLVNEADGICAQTVLAAARIASFAEEARARASQPNADIQKEREIAEIIGQTIELYRGYIDTSRMIVRNSRHAQKQRYIRAIEGYARQVESSVARVQAALNAINRIPIPTTPTSTPAPASTPASAPALTSTATQPSPVPATTSTSALTSTAIQLPPAPPLTSTSAPTITPPPSASVATVPLTVGQKMWTQLYALGDDQWHITIGKILLWIVSIGTAGLVPGVIWCGWTAAAENQ